MKKLLFFITVAFLISTSSAFASTSYSTSKRFLDSEGYICKMATDGCNSVSVNNGKLGASTLMACLQSNGYTEKPQVWSCTDYKDSYKISVSEKTSSLSDFDKNSYINLKTKLSAKTVLQLENSVERYKVILSKYSSSKIIRLNNSMITKVDEKIAVFGNMFQRNVLLLNLFKLELKILGNEISSRIDLYSCDSSNNYTVDYGFNNESVKVFLSNSLVPVYAGEKISSSSGTKYEAGNNTLWFKEKNLTIYNSNNTIINNCTIN